MKLMFQKMEGYIVSMRKKKKLRDNYSQEWTKNLGFKR